METRHYWEENGHAVKYDNYNSNDGFGRASGGGGGAGDQLNFAAPSEDEAEYPPGSYLKKGKVSRQDPMSHRIIEKRRRDRMNNCLADLSRLIPPEYLKKGRGRVEKTEIIEMAIRHLKYLQDRANATERSSGADAGVGEEHYRAGYQEAVTEAVRFLVEVQGYGPADGLCVQLAGHLQRHVQLLTKGETVPREKPNRSHPGSSSDTGSSSGSSRGFAPAPVIAQAPPAPTPASTAAPATGTFPDPYETPPSEPGYSMDCDRVSVPAQPMVTDPEVPEEPLPLDTRRKREPTLRAVRKPDHDDYLHSYKFKNSIERRFSRSQDNETTDMRVPAGPGGAGGACGAGPNKTYTHKRRRAPHKPQPAHSSTSGSTEDTSPQDTSSESPHHHHYDKLPPPTQYVPVFALNALGKYYVPLSVDYACLSRHLGPYDVLDARAVHLAAPLHPVTIHVNFQPCLNYHVKREPSDREWRA